MRDLKDLLAVAVIEDDTHHAGTTWVAVVMFDERVAFFNMITGDADGPGGCWPIGYEDVRDSLLQSQATMAKRLDDIMDKERFIEEWGQPEILWYREVAKASNQWLRLHDNLGRLSHWDDSEAIPESEMTPDEKHLIQWWCNSQYGKPRILCQDFPLEMQKVMLELTM